MRARKMIKGVGGSNKGAAYHQVPSSASYDDGAPEMVSIDMNSSSSDTSSSSLKSTSSTVHMNNYGDKHPLCKSSPSDKVAKNSSSRNGKKAYNLEQIMVVPHEKPLRPRDTNCHNKSPFSSPAASFVPSWSLGHRTLLGKNDEPLLRATNVNSNDDNSCTSGDELNHINRGAKYHALDDSFEALVEPGSRTLNRSSSTPILSATNHLVRALQFRPHSPSITTLTAAMPGYTSIWDKEEWPAQFQEQPVPTPPQGLSSLPSVRAAPQQSRSPVQSPLQDENSMRQSPTKPPTPTPAPASSSSATAGKSQQADKAGEWTVQPTVEKPRKPRQASPSASPSISSPSRLPEQLSPSRNQQEQTQSSWPPMLFPEEQQQEEFTTPPRPSSAPPLSCTQDLPIVINSHGCWSWDFNALAPSDEMDEILAMEQVKQTAGDLDATAVANTTGRTTTTILDGDSEAETVNSVEQVKQQQQGQQELSRDMLRQEEALFVTEESPPRPTTTTAVTTASGAAKQQGDVASETKNIGSTNGTAAATATSFAYAAYKIIKESKAIRKACLTTATAVTTAAGAAKDAAPDTYTSNTQQGDVASETKSIGSTNGTTAATATSFSSAAYKIIKESKANRKALANQAKWQPMAPATVDDDPESLLERRNSILDDSISRGTALSSKVSFYREDNVRYYKLSEEERHHKRSGSLPSLCATADECREIKNVLASLYFDGIDSICNIQKRCNSGKGISEILDEQGPLEFIVCGGGGSKECDSSASVDSFGSYSTATPTPAPTRRKRVRKSPRKLVATVSASDTRGQKDDAMDSIDAEVYKITKRAWQQRRQKILNRQRQQESLVLDDENDDDIVIAPRNNGIRDVSPFQVSRIDGTDMSRIESIEDSLSESGCRRGSGEKGVCSPPDGSPALDFSKEKLAGNTEVMNGTPADKENVGGRSSRTLAMTKASTTTATGSLLSPDSKSDIEVSVE